MANIELAERPTNTVRRFFQNWTTAEPQRITAELVSVHNETHRKWDEWIYLVRDNQLVDPQTNKPVDNFIQPGIEKYVFNHLQAWAATNESGVSLWVSPPLEGIYPCAKTVIHQIGYNEKGEKIVRNSAMVMDTDQIINPNHKRRTLYTMPDKSDTLTKIEKWVFRKVDPVDCSVDVSINITQFAESLTTQLVHGVPPEILIQQMIRVGFLGNNPISCPSGQESYSRVNALWTFSSSAHLGYPVWTETTSQVTKNANEDEYGSLKFNCPHCGHENTRPRGKLIKYCQSESCKKDVSCGHNN